MPASGPDFGAAFGRLVTGPGWRNDNTNDTRGFGETFHTNSNPDFLNQARGTQYEPINDLQRLEVLGANESGPLNERLGTQLGQIQGTADRTGEARAVAEATTKANNASSNDAAQFERATRGMGLSARQQTSANRSLGLARSINRAEAAGGARRGSTDLAKLAQSGSGGFEDAMFGQRVSGETSLASSYAAKKAAEAQADADKKGGFISTVGTVAGAALSFFSSEHVKHDLGHEEGLLSKLNNVRVNRWQYKGDDKTHVGPFAEEFNREFGIDTDRPDTISVIDALGVTLGAVKELNKKISDGK